MCAYCVVATACFLLVLLFCVVNVNVVLRQGRTASYKPTAGG